MYFLGWQIHGELGVESWGQMIEMMKWSHSMAMESWSIQLKPWNEAKCEYNHDYCTRCRQKYNLWEINFKEKLF